MTKNTPLVFAIAQTVVVNDVANFVPLSEALKGPPKLTCLTAPVTRDPCREKIEGDKHGQAS